MRDEISIYRKKLRLSSSLMDIYPTIEEEDKEEFLLILLKELYKEREEKRKLRNLKKAGFGVIKTLEDYDFSEVKFPGGLSLALLESLRFIEKSENLILYGAVGTGKTHLAIALGVEAINQGKEVVFYKVHDLINLLEDEARSVREKVQRKINKADLLILDEWGYLPLHQEGARMLFEIVSSSYETKSIIITTNIEFSRWKGFLFDEKLTAAIVDRLVHHSHMLIFTGESYRMRHSLIR